jgi:hypothetical protein
MSRDKFREEVRHEVWMMGGDPDSLDDEDIDEGYYACECPWDVADDLTRTRRRDEEEP